MKTKIFSFILAAIIVLSIIVPANISYAAVTSIPPSAANITITNNAGKADTVYVIGLYGGEIIKVYNSASGGKLIGSASVSLNKTEGTVTITQLGMTSGSIYVSLTGRGELESARTKVNYAAEVKSDSPDADSIIITNNAGKADTIYVVGLYGGEVIKVYNSASEGKLLGSINVPLNKTEGTVTITQLGMVAGSVFVSITNKGELESDRTKVDYPAEPKSDAIDAGSIIITNNAGINDTILVNHLSLGDIVKVYDAAKGGNLLGSATLPYSKTEVTITIPQLGKTAGSVYISVTSKGMVESDRTKADFPAEGSSDAPYIGNIAVANNSGASDTISVVNLAAGDEVRVYDSTSGGNILGSASVSSPKTEATVTIPQLGTAGGSIYVSVISKGRFESSRTKVVFSAEPNSNTVNVDNITIANNTGKADTVKIKGLTSGDTVKVYDAASGGNLLGSATVVSSGTEATVTIFQLGIEAGSVYVSITSKGKTESGRIRAYYSAESVSDTVEDNNITVVNNPAGKSDVVTVIDLTAGDVVKVYDSASGGNLLGSATVASSKTEATVTIPQLGVSAGSVYVSITGTNKLESNRIRVDYSAESKSNPANGENITITNNAGISDTVQVTDLTEGDVVKVYDSAAGGKLLGSATVPAYGSYAVVTISQLGTSAGSVYVSITSINKIESNRIKIDYSAETTSDAVANDNIIITNNAGASDTVQIVGLNIGDQVKVYDSPRGGTLLGSATVTGGTTATISITQLGSTAGSVYVSITIKNKLESERIKADYPAESKSEEPLADNIVIANNVGTSDTIKISGLSGGDTVNIYDSAKGGTLLGTATVSTYDTSVNISVTQLGSTAGSVYVSITSKNKLESNRVKAVYSAEAKSGAPLTGNITVINNAGMSDTVKVTGLNSDDVVNIYDSAKAGNLLGTATVSTYDSSVTIPVTQLGSAAGSVYVSVTGKARLESERTKVDYSAEPKSNTLSTDAIVINNNAGISDTVKVTGLSGGETVSVYDAAVGGSLMGSASADTYASYATVTITQLGTSAGSVYVSVTQKGCQESDRTKADYSAEQKSNSSDSRNIVVTNNAGAPDTVQINCLSGEDVVNVYDKATGGNLLGTATVPTYGSYVTITITQLGTSGGNIYLSVKSIGKLESNRTTVPFAAEQKSDPPFTSNITVTNNAGISDTIKVTFLNPGDLIKVYDSITDGKLLGSATVPDGSTETTVNITQLGTSAGKIYVSVTGSNKLESERTVAYYTEEPITNSPYPANIQVVNNARIADTITVIFLNANDIVKVYNSATGGSLLGSATVTVSETQATVSIAQLGTSAGSVYVSVTSIGKNESARVKADYLEEQKSDPPATNNIVIKNNAGMSDTITVAFLDAGDIIKVYDSAEDGNLLGSATVASGSTEVTIKITQLGTSAGKVHITVTGTGKLESDRTLTYYAAEPMSDAPAVGNITVTNNTGKSDTVQVTGLTTNDIIRVYDSATGGNLLGSATVLADSTEVTIKIAQLGVSGGNIYVSVTSMGAYESDRTRVSYGAEY